MSDVATLGAAEFHLPRLVHQFALRPADIILAGISASRGPEAYTFRVGDELPPCVTGEDAAASKYCADRPCTLVKIGDLAMTPVPADQVAPANYQGIDLDGDLDAVFWGIRKILEMQRHMSLPDSIGGIGGWGQVTSIYPDRIEQRVLQRWDDQKGPPIRPEPIDWHQWHADNPKPGTTLPAGMSRARRDMLDRKARKHGLQVVK